MAKRGRPFAYQSDDEKPVTVSLRLPREVYTQAQRYVRMHHPMTLTELLLDGLQLRLDTPADPRDLILSDDNTVIQEVQEMIRAAVQAEVAKVRDFLGRQVSTPEAMPVPELSHDDNTVIQQGGAQTLADPETATPAAASTRRKGGRPTTVRPRILDLLHAHPEGLTAVELKVHLGIAKNIGDTIAGMVRDQLLEKQGTRPQVRYMLPESV